MDNSDKPIYRRILLKLSGEALQGDHMFGIDAGKLSRIAQEVASVTSLGIQVALVIGAGNLIRGEGNIERVARRKLLQLHAATELASLRIPPGNRLEALKADRMGQHSIRINDQWRICFVWQADGAHNVEIVDYH